MLVLHIVALKDLRQNYPFLFYGMFAGPPPGPVVERLFPYAVDAAGKELRLTERKHIFPYGFNRLPRYFMRHYDELGDKEIRRVAFELMRVYKYNTGTETLPFHSVRFYRETWSRRDEVENWDEPDTRRLLREVQL